MDYEGKYFPEEDDEEISKGKRRFKKIRRWIFYSIIITVYVVAFTVLLANCEPDMYEKYVFSKTARDMYEKSPEDFEVYEIFPQSWMTYDGGVQIKGIAYTPNTNEMEIGIKYNKKYIDDNGVEPIFELHYVYGEKDIKYDIVNTTEDKKGRYCYRRISYSIDPLILEDNPYINPESRDDEDSDVVDSEIADEMTETYKYVLIIKYPDSTAPNYNDKDLDEQSRSIIVYNNKTAIQLTKYE